MFLRGQVGFDLPADYIDRNFYDLSEQATRLAANPPVPLSGIVDVQFSGDRITLHRNNGERLGPFVIPRPPYVWRGDFAPSTSYEAFDVFGHPDGIFLVLKDHTSGGSPSPTLTQQVFGPLGTDNAARPVTNIEEAAMALGMDMAGWYLRSPNGCNFTILSDAAAGWVDGVNFVFHQSGLEPIRWTASDGVTINHSSARLAETLGQNTVAYLRRVGPNTWDLDGALRAAA